jgi:hypothetical protein
MDEFQKEVIAELRDATKGLAIIIVILALMLFVFVCDFARAESANLPEHADLTFTDIADLDRQVDSVLAVCDSAMTKAEVDFLVAEGWDVYNPVICRRFAGLTIMWMPGEPRPGLWTYPPTRGMARLWWWEVSE